MKYKKLREVVTSGKGKRTQSRWDQAGNKPFPCTLYVVLIFELFYV